MARFARGVLYGRVQEFQVRRCIIITTLIVVFFGISETLLLDQKNKIELFRKWRLKEMEIFTIMVVSSAMKDKTDCYVKVVRENYYCDMSECTYPKICLLFLSEEHYNKIEEIGKMFEKFFDLEYCNKGNDFIHYDYLKKIINCLKECEVMEVLSDHPDAFHLKFYNITQFIDVLETSFLARKGEDMCEKKKNIV